MYSNSTECRLNLENAVDHESPPRKRMTVVLDANEINNVIPD